MKNMAVGYRDEASVSLEVQALPRARYGASGPRRSRLASPALVSKGLLNRPQNPPDRGHTDVLRQRRHVLAIGVPFGDPSALTAELLRTAKVMVKDVK
jgi:hypothetical protein